MKTRILAFTTIILMLVSMPFTVLALEIIPQIYADDINEYEAYVREKDDLPIDFVTYHALSVFGNFHSFCSYSIGDELYNYYYVINVQEDISVVISIYKNKSVDHNLERVDLSQIVNNMLYVKEPKACVIQSEGFLYQYYDCGMEKGRLASISWTIGDLTFDIGCSSQEFDNLSPDSLLGRMLSASREDRISAKSEIMQNIILDWLRNNIGMIVVIFITMITSAMLFAGIGKRYRRKNSPNL